MRVNTLTMQNFRCFTDKTVQTPEQRCLFLGDHGVGKSTTFDAVRFLMSGRCRGLNKNGHGVEDALLRFGCDTKSMAVSATVAHGGKEYTLTRTWANGQGQFRVAGWQGSTSAQQQEWLDVLGVTMDGLSALLDSETFFALDSAEAKTLVLTFLKVSVELPDGTFIDLDELERRYEAAFVARRDAARDVKTLRAPTVPSEDVGDIAAIEALLGRLAKEREDLMLAKAKMQGEGVVYQKQYDALDASLKALKAEIARTPDPQADIDALDARATSTQAELDGVLAQLEASGDTGTGFDALLAQAATLKAHKPSGGCVLSNEIKCPAKAGEFKAQAKALETLAEDLKAAHVARAGLTLTKSGLTGLMDVLQRERIGLLGKVQARQGMLDEELALISQMDALAPKLPEQATDTSAIDEQVTVLDGRLVKGNGILKTQLALKASWERYREDDKATKKASEVLAKASEDVKVYGPDGLRVPALAKVIPAFEATVNSALSPFGYTVAVSPDPFELRVNGLKYVTLSASEKLRVGIALQIALARTTGVGFTLIDQLDMLLTAPRTVLTKMLLSEDVGLDQVWLARAFEPAVAAPVIAGATVVRL